MTGEPGGSWLLVWPRDGSSLPMRALGCLLLMLVALLGARAVWWWGRTWRDRCRPLWLFIRIGGAVGLGAADRWRLWRLARAEGLVSPLTLMLSAGTLRLHAERYLSRLPRRRGRRAAGRLDAIEKHLFG